METTWSATDMPSVSLRRPHWLKLMLRQPNIVAGALLLLAIAATTIGGAVVGLPDPMRFDVGSRFLGPSLAHPFGTDQYGRDVFSRIVWGTRLSISFGIATLVVGSCAGLAIGAIAGYAGGIVDTLLSRAVDTIMSFPLMLIAIVILSALGVSTATVILSIGIILSPRFARLIRAQVLQAKALGYVEAARAMGASGARILVRHILPNCTSPWIVMATLTIPYAILVESSLSFLGLGVEPDTPTWGRIIADGRSYVQGAPWITIAPGLAITVCTIGFNLLGDGIRDLLDPRLKT